MSAAQILTFGHALSPATKRWLGRIHPGFRVFQVLFHAEKLCDIETAAEAVLDKALELGADPSGRTLTYIVCPGLGVGALTLAAGWMGITGKLPHVLNLMQMGPHYVPSPELPFVDLGSFKNNVGRKRRAAFFDGVEECQAA